jgi:hypothetical protein
MSEKHLATLKAYRATLERIARGYQTPAQLRRSVGRDCGLNYEEGLEMAYENIQQEARNVLKRFRMPREPRAGWGGR